MNPEASASPPAESRGDGPSFQARWPPTPSSASPPALPQRTEDPKEHFKTRKWGHMKAPSFLVLPAGEPHLGRPSQWILARGVFPALVTPRDACSFGPQGRGEAHVVTGHGGGRRVSLPLIGKRAAWTGGRRRSAKG